MSLAFRYVLRRDNSASGMAAVHSTVTRLEINREGRPVMRIAEMGFEQLAVSAMSSDSGGRNQGGSGHSGGTRQKGGEGSVGGSGSKSEGKGTGNKSEGSGKKSGEPGGERRNSSGDS